MDSRYFNYQNNLLYSNDTNLTSVQSTDGNRQLLFPAPIPIPNQATDIREQQNKRVQEQIFHNDAQQSLPSTVSYKNTNNLQNVVLSRLDQNLLNQNEYMQNILSNIIPLLNVPNQTLVHDQGTTSVTLNDDGNIAKFTEKLEISNAKRENRNNIEEKNIVSLKRKNEDDISVISPSKRHRERELRVMTGTIEKIIYWNKIMPPSIFCLYEVIAPCISIRDGSIQFQKNLLLRDERGPVLQVTYYESELLLDPNIIPGTLVRCVGRMATNNRLVAMKINTAPDSIKYNLHRLTFKSEHVINRLPK